MDALLIKYTVNVQPVHQSGSGSIYVYGDAGYVGSEPWVVYAVCNGHNNVQIIEMNYQMSMHCISVEWGYGCIVM